ncbi:MAG: tRNA (N(6)-L-threonylcarbamoyladenosine(37)-C(2))-methylthiotransferase [Infirmifilum sp.]
MRIFIETFGCWLNKGESNIMRTLLREAGHEIVDSPEKADVAVINTCAVRGDTETKIFRELKNLNNLRTNAGFRVVVTGCLVNVRPKSILEIIPDASLVEPDSLEKIVEVVESPVQKFLLRRYSGDRTVLPEFEGGVTYILPIQSGCLGACSFCIEWVTRGLGVKSYPVEQIVKAVEKAVKKGAKEIYLVGQDLATYGYDLGINLAALIERILVEVDGEYRLRLGMMEPMLLSTQIERLISFMKDERIYRYFHVPVQSGDDRVLKAMNRKYTVAEYRELVGKIRSTGIPSSVVTDLIVGFPGEDEEAFKSSLKLIEDLMFDKVHVARYTLRPFTKGYTMKGLPEPVKKLRSKIATEISLKVAYEVNKKYIGKTTKVLVNTTSPRGDFMGRTPEYKPVVFKGYELTPGTFVKARITEASSLNLIGEVLD